MFFFPYFFQQKFSQLLAALPAQQTLPGFVDSINLLLKTDDLGSTANSGPLHQTLGIKNKLTLRGLRQIIYDHPPIQSALCKQGKELMITPQDAIKILLAKRMTSLRVPIENRNRVLEELDHDHLDTLLESTTDILKDTVYSTEITPPATKSNDDAPLSIVREEAATYLPAIKTVQKFRLAPSIELEWANNALPCSPEVTIELLESLLTITHSDQRLSNASKDILEYARKRLLTP